MSLFVCSASVTIQAWSLVLDCLLECVEIGSAFYFVFFCRPSQFLSYMPGRREEKKPPCLSFPPVGSVFSLNVDGIVLCWDFLAH